MKYTYLFILVGLLMSCEKENSLAPVALFDVHSLPISRFKYELNASKSFSSEGYPLKYRWDTDGDKLWDTEWSTIPNVVAVFPFSSTGVVGLEVKDDKGTSMAIYQEVNEVQGTAYFNIKSANSDLDIDFRRIDYSIFNDERKRDAYWFWAYDNIVLPTEEEVYNKENAYEVATLGSLCTWSKAMAIEDDRYMLPNQLDWEDLVNYFGTASAAGYNFQLDNVYGLQLALAGVIEEEKHLESGESGYYWTATEVDEEHAVAMKILWDRDYVEFVSLPKSSKASVRLFYKYEYNK